jgi:phosphotransferase system HPr (HPr) family protein
MNAAVSDRPLAPPPALPELHQVRRTFVLNLEHGLHARPCAMIVRALLPYHAIVEVEANGETASGKSILGLMALAAAHGAKITFTATGNDCFKAMAAVEQVFASRFATNL